MLRSMTPLAAVVIHLVLALPAAALVIHSTREEFGPPKAGVPIPSDKRFALAHLESRRYWYHTHFDGWGQFRDDVRVAGEADNDGIDEVVRAFRALPITDKEIRVLPGPGVVRSTDGRKSAPCDWEIEWTSQTLLPRGERKERSEWHRAVLTLFVSRAAAIAKADPRTPQWIHDLSDARFTVRQQAFRALANEGDAALPLLQEALGRHLDAERKTRVEQLVARLKPLHLLRMKMPQGIPVVSLDELMSRERQNWRSGDLGKSWYAAGLIAAWAEYSQDAAPVLVEMLQDTRVQVRDLALAAFARLGRRALFTLSELKSAEAPAAESVRPSLRKAIQVIEHAAPDGMDPFWERNRRLRQDIARACAALRQSPK